MAPSDSRNEKRRVMKFRDSTPPPSSDHDATVRWLRDREIIKLFRTSIDTLQEQARALFADVEVPLEQKVAWWHDRYKPRKPKYFNRVHTGYEWNKYNQTHYDHDNPPPKMVQGYKFNVFFPGQA